MDVPVVAVGKSILDVGEVEGRQKVASTAASTLSLDKAEKLPADAVVLQLSGPFGAPAQRVWEFGTILVVGAATGAGKTPTSTVGSTAVAITARDREELVEEII